jgi:hypothetical protein
VNIMKLVSALVGLAALGGVSLSAAPASAMPAGIGVTASETPYVAQAAYVCNDWGHCWHQHRYGGGYYHPHYYGGWGYGGWHHWHHHYYGGGWGYGGWHHWHHWSQW